MSSIGYRTEEERAKHASWMKEFECIQQELAGTGRTLDVVFIPQSGRHRAALHYRLADGDIAVMAPCEASDSLPGSFRDAVYIPLTKELRKSIDKASRKRRDVRSR